MTGAITINWDDELKDLNKTIEALGGVSQSQVTFSVKKAMKPMLSKVKANAPYMTGQLQDSYISVPEKSRTKGKKAYEIVPDRAFNSVLQRPVQHPGLYGSKATKGGHAYYPASMEYGFITRGGGYWPGLEFMKKAALATGAEFCGMVISYMSEKIEKEWIKRHG